MNVNGVASAAGEHKIWWRIWRRRIGSAFTAYCAGGSVLFPEGVSHDDPQLKALKKGAGRLYYRARELQPEETAPPVVIPVGLHYDAKSAFRSNVLIALSDELDVTPNNGEPTQVHGERVAKLTEEFDQVLRRVESEPEQLAKLSAKVVAYDADLHQLDIEDHELDGDPPFVSNWLTVLFGVQIFGVYVLLPPLVIAGLLINTPAIVLLLAATRVFPKLQKDKATIKLLASAALIPLSWTTAGLLVALGHINLLGSYPALPDTPIVVGTRPSACSMSDPISTMN